MPDTRPPVQAGGRFCIRTVRVGDAGVSHMEKHNIKNVNTPKQGIKGR